VTNARPRAEAIEMSDLSRASIAFGADGRETRRRWFMSFVCPVFAATLLCVAAFPLGASQQVDMSDAQPAFDLRFNPETGELTGRLEAGSDVASVIRQIGELARFEPSLPPGLGKLPAALNLDGVKTEVALRQLIRGNSVIIFRSGAEKEPPAINNVRIVVLGASSEPVTPSQAPVASQQPYESEGDGSNPTVTRAASVREIVKLANKADRESISELRDLAVGAEDAALRRAAMSSLAGIAGAESIDLFEHSGLLDPDATVRIEAARSLMRADRHSGSIVEEAAQRETDPSVSEIMERLARGEIVQPVTGLSRARLEQ
jgi:hypothetical protein